ncbi:MAG: uridine kinase [Bacteroidota bacterium]
MIKPYVMGICGGSGSGKTYLLNQLLSKLPADQLTLVSQDNYYLPYEKQDQDEEGLVNFDHPKSIDLELLHVDMMRILGGETVKIKEYTFNNPAHTAKDVIMAPAPLLILEGLFIYHLPKLRELIDLKVFVDAPEYLRLYRRLKRDEIERGYSNAAVLRDYERFVAPMYTEFVEPTKKYCDMIVLNVDKVDKSVEVLSHHLESKLQR